MSPTTSEAVLVPIGPVYGTADLVQLYNHADVMVGSGRGILEAMACGKAAIVLGESGEGEILDASTRVSEAEKVEFRTVD